MTKTEFLYGITDKELNEIIGKGLVEASYNIRIFLLKDNLLNVIKNDGVESNRVDKIYEAINFWNKLRKGDNE